jgi:hypothetical protein
LTPDNGRPTIKYEIILKEFDSSGIMKTYQWIEMDIEFLMKEASVDGSWSVEYINIKQFEPTSDALFEIPADYRRIPINMMNTFMGGPLD